MRTARVHCLLIAAAATVWAGQEIKEGPGEVIVPDEIVLRLKPGATLTGVLRSLNITASAVAGAARLPVQVIRVPQGLRQTISTIIANHPEVEYVEPHRIRTATALTPNDTSFAVQWWLTKLQAGAAWSLLPGRLTAPGLSANRTRIAVLDTGADCTHNEFRNSVGGATDSAAGGQFSYALSQAMVPTTIANPACPWLDDHGHGTHVAGLIAAATNNALGVAGLAFQTELMIFKVLDGSGSGSDIGIANAITAAADSGARVISLSLGGAGYSQLLQDAVNYAWARNSLVIAASGNSGSNSLFFPAGAHYVMGVGATDSADVRASFSNFGFGLDVMAPGVAILSTYPGNLFQTFSGTSMATPLVSAVAGLIATSTSTLAPDALAQRIEAAADSAFAFGGWDTYYGYGRVNALRSLNGTLRPATVGGLTGQVVNASGAPISGAQVTLGAIGLTTGSTGLFRFANMNSGTSTLTVSDGVNPSWSYAVVIPPGSDSALRVAMGVPTGAFTGNVTSGGAALAGAVVQALQAGIVLAASVTDANGLFTLPVPAGTYDVRSSAVGHTAYTQSAQTVAAAGSTFVAMPMLALGTITGTVRDDSQAPLAGVQVTVDNGVYSAGAVTDVSGGFATLGLPAGTYSVSASLATYTSDSVTGVAVIDGALTVANLQLTKTGTLALLTLTRSSIGGGATMTGNTVSLAGPAGVSGATVTITSSNPAIAQPLATVTIPAGATQSAPFIIQTSAVAANTVVTISASLAGSSKSVNFTILPFAVTAVSLSPTTVGGGTATTSNRVYLNSIVPPGGAVVLLTSSDPAVVAVPASLTVPEGAYYSPVFTITTTAVAASTPVTLTATYAGSSKTATLTVTPTALASLAISPLIISGGKPITSAFVTLDSPAPAGGAVVLLSSTDPAAAPPASVTISAGSKSSGYFTIPTTAVAAALPVTIDATYGGVSKTVTITVKPPALSALSVSTTPTAGGKTITGATVSLDGPAPTAGAVVTLVSTNPAVIPPATVNVPPGATVSPAFTIPTLLVASQVQVTLTASYGGVSKSSIVTLIPTALATLSISTTPISGGKTMSGTVTLAGPAPPGGAVVTLSSGDPAVAAPPPTATVPEGATVSPAFTINLGFVAVATPVVITANYGGVSKTVTVNVKPTVLSVLSLSTSPISGGKSLNGTVTLDGPAPPGGAVVTLTSATPGVAAPPPTVTVAAGATASAAFTVTTDFVTSPTPVVMTATYGGVSKTVTVNVKPTALSTLSISTAPISGGRTLSASVTLDGPAPPAGAVVALVSANPGVAAPPPTVTIAPGATVSAAFTVTTGFVMVDTPVVITAAYGGVSKSITANVKPTALSGLSLSTSPISGGKPLGGGSVILDGPAPPAGAVVTLVSANPGVAAPPPTVTVAAGATASAAFTITTGFVTVDTPVVITATYGGVSKSVTVNVKPSALAGLAVSTVPISGGKSITGAYVSIDGPAPPAGAIVTLTSSNPSVAAPPPTVLVGTGAASSTPTFSIATSAVASTVQVTITASYGGVSKFAVITVKPTALLAVAASPLAIKGGLTIGSASVTLDGPAPPGGAVVTLASSNAAAQPAPSVTVPAGATVAAFTIPTQAVLVATPATVTASYGGVSKQVNLTINP